jgi:electron transfer flavoprotein beta subunit
MNIAVVMRQVPDLIEPLEIDASGTALDMGEVRFLVNETDDHALEQAILLKEAGGGTVTVVALDFGEVDDTLYTAAAKGADRIVKIPWEAEMPPWPQAAAAMYAEAIGGLKPDLVLVGVYAHDELENMLAPLLGFDLKLPYVGVIRGVKPGDEAETVRAFKEFPGAAMAQMAVKLPAVLGILAADQPPRYVPVSRIRAAMKSTRFEEHEAAVAVAEPAVTVRRMYHPDAGGRAEMLEGTTEVVAARIAEILVEKGVVK